MYEILFDETFSKVVKVCIYKYLAMALVKLKTFLRHKLCNIKVPENTNVYCKF